MNRLLLPYTGFVLACLMVILAFITATTYTQLAIAILLYPVLVFFAYRVLPMKRRRLAAVSAQEAQPVVSSIEEPAPSSIGSGLGISDIDKRLFLKLIGGAGITLFLFSIFNKKSEGLFSKSVTSSGKVALEDTTGRTIDPSQNQPTDGYTITDIDDNLISFYGFTNKDGAWYIMRADTDEGSFRYVRGTADFPSSWTNRENMSYDYFSNVF